MYKNARGEPRYLTAGGQACDEPEEIERRRRLWESQRSA